MMLRPAEEADRAAIADFLRACGVALPDAAHDRIDTCLVGECGSTICGIADLEILGSIGLVRCIAIRPAHQGAGLGKQLVASVESFARSNGVRELCLLTTAAVPFFAGRGYRVDNRADAPDAVRASPTFAASDAGTAVFMSLQLARDVVPAARIRQATPDDAAAILEIYAPVVAHTAMSFEVEVPSLDEMRARIERTLADLPWLVSVDERGHVNGTAIASRHRERAAYRWAVDATVYVRRGSREQGIGRRLLEELLRQVGELGYCQVFSRVTLPNEPAIRLHQALGFEPQGVFGKVGFKNGAWHDVSWWRRQLHELPAQPREPRRPQPATSA